jgi:glycerate kinase
VRIERPSTQLWPNQVTVAVDVQNRLLGARGCTRVYGPQKGLRPRDFPYAEAALRQLANVVHKQFGTDLANQCGAGAAGGLGFGLVAFAEAKLTPGFDLVAREAKLDAQLRRAGLVITGEGRLDRSTLMGKGVGELAARCRTRGVPCVGLGGAILDRTALAKQFSHVGALMDLTPPASAQAKARVWLERLAQVTARQIDQA